ncbi:MAG: peptide deformylase [Oscillospiraceae bacterium]|nr:peptide deformylase [Oscillospiraceae bacterium]
MEKPIIKDIFFLGQKSQPCTIEDLPLAKDLEDTLAANRDSCVGMAANMIGVRKRAIISAMAGVMFNPVITRKDSPYEAEEGCLSLEGRRKTTRYKNIEVEYLDKSWKKQHRRFSGLAAQIIQHECDHLDGILI